MSRGLLLELAVVVALKLALLSLLYVLFFTPAHRAPVDTAAWIMGTPSAAVPQHG
jgi:hypothetical protein